MSFSLQHPTMALWAILLVGCVEGDVVTELTTKAREQCGDSLGEPPAGEGAWVFQPEVHWEDCLGLAHRLTVDPTLEHITAQSELCNACGHDVHALFVASEGIEVEAAAEGLLSVPVIPTTLELRDAQGTERLPIGCFVPASIGTERALRLLPVRVPAGSRVQFQTATTRIADVLCDQLSQLSMTVDDLATLAVQLPRLQRQASDAVLDRQAELSCFDSGLIDPDDLVNSLEPWPRRLTDEVDAALVYAIDIPAPTRQLLRNSCAAP